MSSVVTTWLGQTTIITFACDIVPLARVRLLAFLETLAMTYSERLLSTAFVCHQISTGQMTKDVAEAQKSQVAPWEKVMG